MHGILARAKESLAMKIGIVFIGSISFGLIDFIIRILMGKQLSQSEYGLFSLSLAILNILVFIACLGLKEGVSRSIAYKKGLEGQSQIRDFIYSSLYLSIISSILVFLCLFFASDLVSKKIFHSPQLAPLLQILAFAIPPIVFIEIASSVFRGLGRVQERVYFRDFLMKGLQLSFVTWILFIHHSLIGAVGAYVASTILSSIFFAGYTSRKLRKLTPNINGAKTKLPMVKEIFFFSLPLLVLSSLGLTMTWTDTLMLGYFTSPDKVGLYNGATPVLQILQLIPASIVFIYVPLASEFIGRGHLAKVREIYKKLTKLGWLLSFPIFLTIFLFAKEVLLVFFGEGYTGAIMPLRILMVGYILVSLFGPVDFTLLSFGKTKFLLMNASIAALVNIVLNILLIPTIGIIGASLATVTSWVVSCLLNFIFVYILTRIQPFDQNFLKPVIILSIFSLASFFVLPKFIIDISSYYIMLISFLLFVIITGLVIIYTQGLTKDILKILSFALGSIGINKK